MLTKLDARVLSLFTKFSHWSQRMFGRTNFWWAKKCSAAGALYWFFWLLGSLFGSDGKSGMNPMWLFAPWLLLFDIQRWQSDCKRFDEMEEHYFSGSQTAHHLTLFEHTSFAVGMRLFADAIALFLTIGLVFTPSNLFWCCLVASFWAWVFRNYFKAVIPMPPGKSKVRQWLESFKAALVPAKPAMQEN